MKKRSLFLVVACAMMLSAQPVFAALATCDDWQGTWTFNYGDAGCDNVTLNEVCNNEDGSNPSCLPVKEGSPQTYWICIARGKRQSDNQTIQIRRISFADTVYAYYEKTNEELFATGGDTPADYIPVSNFEKTDNTTTFTVDNEKAPASAPPPANTGIACGTKGKVACVACGASPCVLKVIPGKVRKLLKLVEPISAIVLISDGNAEFTADDKPVYETSAIIPLLKVKIGTKIMISIVFVNPLSKDSGTFGVTVGDCSGVIQIK